MKKFFINLFRNYPICTGLLSLLIALHVVGVKDLQTPLIAMNENLFPILFFYVSVMLCYMMFILPKINQEKREKATWLTVVFMVVILTIGAKFFIA